MDPKIFSDLSKRPTSISLELFNKSCQLASTHEGVLTKMGGARGGRRNWKSRYFRIKGTFLVYYKSHTALRPKGVVDLKGCQISGAAEQTGKSESICISHPENTFPPYYCYAQSPEERDEWMSALTKAAGDVGSRGSRDTATALLECETQLNNIKEVIEPFLPHNSKIGSLTVTVKEARNVAAVDRCGTSDPYCIVVFDDQEFKTDIKKKNLNPVWDAQFTFSVRTANVPLCLTLMDYNKVNAHVFLGEGRLPFMGMDAQQSVDDLDSVARQPWTRRMWVPLSKRMPKDIDVTGDVLLELAFVPVSQTSNGVDLSVAKKLSSPDEQVKYVIESLQLQLKAQQQQLAAARAEKTAVRRQLLNHFAHEFANLSNSGPQEITLTVKQGQSLLAVDSNGFSDPFATLQLSEQGQKRHKVWRTDVVHKSVNPQWNSEFRITISHPLASVKLSVFDHDKIGLPTFLGEATLELWDLNLGVTHDLWLHLEEKSTGKPVGVTGQINVLLSPPNACVEFVEPTVAPAASSSGGAPAIESGSEPRETETDFLLEQAITQATLVKEILVSKVQSFEERMATLEGEYETFVNGIHDLFSPDYNRFCRPEIGRLVVSLVSLSCEPLPAMSCEVVLAGTGHKTPTIKASDPPFAIGQEFEFAIHSLQTQLVLRLLSSADEARQCVGMFKRALWTLQDSSAREMTCPLKSTSNSGVSVGDLKVKLTFSGLVAPKEESNLDYSALKEILIEEGYTTLSLLFDALDAAEQEKAVPAVLHVCEVEQRAVDLVLFFCDQELRQTLSEATLFRRNSAASKMATSYAKMCGLSYLERTLHGVLSSLCEQDEFLEIDQNKLSGADTDVQSNIAKLLEWSQKVLDAIVNSIEECPRVLRSLWGSVQSMAIARFPTTRDLVLGGMVFLRFWVPAVTAPEGFHVIEGVPGKNARRTLILISKLLQNLSNGVEFGKKEEYMLPLNAFIAKNRPVLEGYFERLPLCAGETEEEGPKGCDTLDESILSSGDWKLIHLLCERYLDKMERLVFQKPPAEASKAEASVAGMKDALARLGDADAELETMDTEGDLNAEAVLAQAYQVQQFYRTHFDEDSGGIAPLQSIKARPRLSSLRPVTQQRRISRIS